MRVTLISVDDNRLSAWKHSRPSVTADAVSLEELDQTPFSLHSLMTYTFEVEMARVMLDLMANFTTRMWSQTSRIIPIPEVELDFYSEVAQRRLDLVKENNKSGTIPQDIIRLDTPVFSKIGWTFSMDKRLLFGFLKSLKRYQIELYSIYAPLFYNAMGVSEKDVIESNFGELVFVGEDFFDKLSEHEGINYIEGIAEDNYNMISQFNRHADTTIITSLWTTSFSDLESMTMRDKIPYYYNVNKHIYRTKILSHRACWIADWNNWSDRVENQSNGEGIKYKLPCEGEGGKCKYMADLKARIDGNDPNLPCPIYMNDPKLIDERERLEGVTYISTEYKKLF